MKMEAFSGLFPFSIQFNNKTRFVGGAGVNQCEITIHLIVRLMELRNIKCNFMLGSSAHFGAISASRGAEKVSINATFAFHAN